jgi:hypothetical protein
MTFSLPVVIPYLIRNPGFRVAGFRLSPEWQSYGIPL